MGPRIPPRTVNERVTGLPVSRSHVTPTIPEERPLTPSSDGGCYNTIPIPSTNVNKKRGKLIITTHYLFITTYLKMSTYLSYHLSL